MARNTPFQIAGVTINPGERQSVVVSLAKLYTATDLNLEIEVINGKSKGPVLLICAAIHGDEINGVEICRQLLKHRSLSRVKGTLIIVPIVNVFGFIHQSRYLPDRRDLNRCFPGSQRGSLGARVAHIFRTEIVEHCTHLIDLHTGAIHRSNLPQVRTNCDHPECMDMANAFGAPVIISSKLRDGSLRQCADEESIVSILYEAGEALRFDDQAIKAGLHGILNVMRHLKMLPKVTRRRAPIQPMLARSSTWMRAEADGVCRNLTRLGQKVQKGDLMGIIASPYGKYEYPIKATIDGVVIGKINIPLINEGDALYHVASFAYGEDAERKVEQFTEEVESQPLPEDRFIKDIDSAQ